MEEKEEYGSANMKRLQEETLTEQLACGRGCFLLGATVLLEGLKRAQELNGKRGKLVRHKKTF